MRFRPILGALVLLLAACASDTPSDGSVLISLTDELIVPAYQQVAQDMAQLERDAKALCDAPGQASLEAARHSWRAARASWTRSEAMWFGPVMERRSISRLDWSPVDVEGIEGMLATKHSIATGEVREVLAANQRGFGAIEHVLFNSEALTRIAGSMARCSYLTALTEVAREETDAILSEWVDGTERRPPYQDYFTGRADAGILTSAAVAGVVRTQVFLIRDIVDMRLAAALGLRGGGPDLSAIPGGTAGNGLADLRHEIMGMQAVYQGGESGGLGVSDLVRPLSVETDQRLRDQFAAAVAAIDSAEGPLRNAAVQRPGQVRSIYDRLLEVQRTISTEVVSLLGVSVGFTDTDGDSSR